jgi:hypothetical protein
VIVVGERVNQSAHFLAEYDQFRIGHFAEHFGMIREPGELVAPGCPSATTRLISPVILPLE